MTVKPIPDGYHSVTPYLVVKGAVKLIEFLEGAFGGKVSEKMMRPDGTVGHTEVRIGDSVLMLSDATGPHKPMPSCLYHYVNDVDTVYRRALQAGGTSMAEPANQFWGDRCCGVVDPSGNSWWIATRVEEVPLAELERRAAEQFAQQKS
ncbi:MAG: VOC family protein [Candidatus Zixiibacteriota bacterium]